VLTGRVTSGDADLASVASACRARSLRSLKGFFTVVGGQLSESYRILNYRFVLQTGRGICRVPPTNWSRLFLQSGRG
jgi:hypothetical protein